MRTNKLTDNGRRPTESEHAHGAGTDVDADMAEANRFLFDPWVQLDGLFSAPGRATAMFAQHLQPGARAEYHARPAR